MLALWILAIPRGVVVFEDWRRGIELQPTIGKITVSVTHQNQEGIEQLSSPLKRRRRWSKDEKWKIVRESFEPSRSLQTVAAKYNVHPSQLSHWRKLYRTQVLWATWDDEEVK
ncbi:transposase [Burkholderia ubonensis]|uniref:transposase n=1 Tax=Burkholderia ubonensis TaxID=101571 RepID=UPI0009B404E2|nr:transposase [Burkholderia ubonensis]